MGDGDDASQVLRSVVAGAFGGMTSCFSAAPFDLVKVRQQMSGLPATTIFKSVIKNEGVRGLWRGILPPTMVAAPQFAVSFACFDINRRLVRGWFGRDPAAKDELVDVAAAGALVAIPTSFFFAPADRVKCLLQYDGARLEAGKPARYKGGLDCAAKVLRQGGLRSLFSGFGMTLCRDVPGWAVYFGTYHSAKSWLAGPDAGMLDGSVPLSLFATIVAGAMAGFANWGSTIPIDVMKTRWQMQPLEPPPSSSGSNANNGAGVGNRHWKPGSPATLYTSYAHMIRCMLQEPAGFRTFFAGFWAAAGGSAPRVAVCFAATEMAHRAMSLHLDADNNGAL